MEFSHGRMDTVKQVAEYPQMSNNKVYDMAKKGELPAVKIRQQ